VDKKAAILLIIVAGSLWGCIGYFNRNMTAVGLGQTEIAYCRLLIAWIGMLAVILIKDKSLLKIKLRDLWCFVGTGMISLLCLNLTYMYAMQHMTLSVAALLLSTSPAYVMLLSAILFKEQINSQKVVALAVMLAGCVFVTGVLESEIILSPKGILLGLASGICYALYSIFGCFAINKGYHSETISFYSFLLAYIGVMPLTDTMLIIQPMNINLLLLIIGLGVITCTLPYMFYTKGLSGVENSTAAILATSEPIAATLVGVICFHESMSMGNIVGIVLIIASIVIMNWQRKKYK